MVVRDVKVLDNSDVCQSLKDCLAENLEKSADTIRNKPWPAVLWAVCIGYLLHLLPLGRIASLLLRAVLALLKPLAVLWLIGKIWEKAANPKSKPTPPLTENPPQEP